MYIDVYEFTMTDGVEAFALQCPMGGHVVHPREHHGGQLVHTTTPRSGPVRTRGTIPLWKSIGLSDVCSSSRFCFTAMFNHYRSHVINYS